MLANRKPPAKPSPPASYASRSKATATPFVVDWDDDDDFQSPPHASRARPLKPCSGNGAASRRPGKKLKSSSSSGKENCPVSGDTVPAKKVGASAPVPEVAETLAVGSRVSGGVPEAEVLMGGEICGLLKSGSDGFKLGRNGKKVVDVYGDCKGGSSSFPNSVDSRVMVRGAACDLGDGHCEEAQAVRARHCSSVLEEHAVTEMGNPESDPPTIEKELSGSDAREEADSSMLIRPMLLESDAKCECRLAGSNDSKGLHSGILSSVIDEWNLNREDSLVSDCGYGLHNSNDHLDSLEPKLSCPKLNYDAGGGDCHEAQKLGTGACNLVSQESEVTTATPENETTEDKSSGPEASNGHCCSNSSESKIVDSHMILDFEGDGYGDFEIGTQLNELINLCIEGCVEGHPECRVSPIEDTFVSNRSESDIQVQCPLCGSDISDLSEEFRQQHTNNCIDEDEPAKECYSNHEREPDTGENVENSRVLEWLRKLGLSLSKYEEIFVREEVDWETLQWLTEDLIGMGITSLGPRKKITHALGELRKKHDHANDMEADVLRSENTKKTKLPMNGNKLITEYFRWSSSDQRQRRVCKVNKPSNLNEQKGFSAKTATKRNHAGKGKVKDKPLWCCIPGTPFRVDAFRYLRGDCCHWFLTHFHIDHYQGLTRSFCHRKIYCSSITASLVHHKIGIPWDRLHVLPLNEKITIAVLNTGDFRFSSEMLNNPVLQSSHTHTLILDTTYCNPRYDFPSQEIVIQFVMEAIQAEAFNPKTLFLIGSYKIGKERLCMEDARLLQKKIYVGAVKLQILKPLELPQEIMHWFTANEAESHIHVVPMWTLASFKRMKFLCPQYAGRFDLIVAFCPTGWSFGKGRKRTPGKRWQQGSTIRYEVPYSEHSSFRST